MESVKRITGSAALAPSAKTLVEGSLYGCEHLQRLLSQSQKTMQASLDHYDKAQRTIFCKMTAIAQTPKALNIECDIGVTSLRPTFLCLQCPAICTSQERGYHQTSKGHMFAVESSSGCLYCHLCQDFIYDPRFEELRAKKGSSPTSKNKKRKLSELYPATSGNQYIAINSSALPCCAGIPRGLFNLGQTCFVSVVLQTVIHNPIIRNFFLGGGHDSSACAHPNCVSCALDDVFADLYTTTKVDGYAALNLLLRSWLCDQALAGYQQQDAHQYFQFLLNQLHITNCESDHTESDVCQCTFHLAFYGKLQSNVTCGQCRNVSIATDPIMDLSLDLQVRAKTQKAKSLEPEPNELNQTTNLTSCLKTFTSCEKLQPDAYTCTSHICGGQPQRASKELGIKKLPPVLCMQLKKFEHTNAISGKLNTKLQFPLQLDMFPYTTRGKKYASKAEKSVRISQIWYDLSSVVVHKGKLDSGHYVCYCREAENWFLFDDSKVTLTPEAEVLGVDAYLLFYLVRSLDGCEPSATGPSA